MDCESQQAARHFASGDDSLDERTPAHRILRLRAISHRVFCRRSMDLMMTFSLLVAACLSAHSAFADSADIAQRPIYIDVRSPSEYESGHLRGAYNLNFDTVGKRIHELTSARNTPIILYCQSGRRSGFAKEALEGMGFVNVANAGGLNDVLRQHGGAAVVGPAACGAGEC